MAEIIEGTPDTFNALTMGMPHPSTQQFIDSQMDSHTGMLTEQGQQFFDRGMELYRYMEESQSARRVQAAQRAVESIWQDENIRRLASTAELQWAPSVMQKYIMAEPTVRQMYHDQRVEGYDGMYVDAYPDDIGESHYHYRQVMNGVVEFSEDDDEDSPEWSATTYYDDDEEEGERELDLLEQIDILDTWSYLLDRLRHGKQDPTSRYNADL